MLHDLIQCDCCHQNRSAVSQCVDLHICTDVLGLDEGLDGKIFRKYAQMSVRDFDLEHRGDRNGNGTLPTGSRIRFQIDHISQEFKQKKEKVKCACDCEDFSFSMSQEVISSLYSVSRRSQFNFR